MKARTSRATERRDPAKERGTHAMNHAATTEQRNSFEYYSYLERSFSTESGRTILIRTITSIAISRQQRSLASVDDAARLSDLLLYHRKD